MQVSNIFRQVANMRTNRYNLVLLVCALRTIFAYPDGPPVSRTLCAKMTPRGHGPTLVPPQVPPPYRVVMDSNKYEIGMTIIVTITGMNDTDIFRGFFVQARRLDRGNMTEALGTFSNAPDGTQTLSCDTKTKLQNAWGHSNNHAKYDKSVRWTAPDKDEGDLVFVATIVQGSFKHYWTCVKSDVLIFNEETKLGRGEDKASKDVVNKRWKDKALNQSSLIN